MNNPKIVIGAGYGDEGKGLVTDYLSAKYGADVVVRFNGGAQAGHTVKLPSGERHVFSHFGAGSLAGATTFLSRDFIVNPMVFFKEEFEVARTIPDVYVDPRAIITTPYDMLLNQLAEESRGDSRHGSCGLGINETVTRHLNTTRKEYQVFFDDFCDPDRLKSKLEVIRDVYFRERCHELGINPLKGKDVIESDNVLKNFIADAALMYEECEVEIPDFLYECNQVIFEGAQGLLLDQDYGVRPHVTRSNTGCQNALKVLDEIMASREVDLYYVTRCYTTRHGAGPLPNEMPVAPYQGVVDETNISNTYQGSLRFAYLDIDVLVKAIKHDITICKDDYGFVPNVHLVVTCLDQAVNEPVKVYHKGRLETLRGDAYADVGDMIHALTGLNCKLLKSFGPTRNDVVEKE